MGPVLGALACTLVNAGQKLPPGIELTTFLTVFVWFLLWRGMCWERGHTRSVKAVHV
jgi:hypothetical protein